MRTNLLLFKNHASNRIMQRTVMDKWDVNSVVQDEDYCRIGMDLKKKNVYHYVFYSIKDKSHYILVVDEKCSQLITVMPLEYSSWCIDPEVLTYVRNVREARFKIATLRKKFDSKKLNAIGCLFKKSKTGKDKLVKTFNYQSASVFLLNETENLIPTIERIFTEEDINFILNNNKKEEFILNNSSLDSTLEFYLTLFKNEYSMLNEINSHLGETKLVLETKDYYNQAVLSSHLKFLNYTSFQKIYFNRNLKEIFDCWMSDLRYPKFNITTEVFNNYTLTQYIPEEDRIILIQYIGQHFRPNHKNNWGLSLTLNNDDKIDFIHTTEELELSTIFQYRKCFKVIEKNLKEFEGFKLSSIKSIVIFDNKQNEHILID